MGPGTIISVAYIDPDNFQTAVSSGAQFKYKLLFMVLVSNIIAVFLQSLSVKLGTVTGMDMAQMNRAHLPRWLNIGLWIMAEAAIVCTDIGHWNGHCNQHSDTQDTTCCWLRSCNCRYAFHPVLL